jgi:hypothetical protein
MHLLDVPYERQLENWTCGAAALCMAYRSFGLDARQAEVWTRVKPAHGDRHRRGAPTSALIRHALAQGFSALALRAADPWRLLRRCFRPDLRAIVFPRRGYDTSGLHAAVLRGMDDEAVVLHDPYGRPDRQLPRDDFLALWGPHLFATSGRGYLLMVVARTPPDEATCSCGLPAPAAAACPRCRLAIPLVPVVSGCGKVGCPGLDWQELHCPQCEGVLNHVPFASGDLRCLPPN